jgi:hypothetical protein
MPSANPSDARRAAHTVNSAFTDLTRVFDGIPEAKEILLDRFRGFDPLSDRHCHVPLREKTRV